MPRDRVRSFHDLDHSPWQQARMFKTEVFCSALR